jgi:anti-sigma factor RsiW
MTGQHLSPQDVAVYLDGQLDSASRRETDAHLADCFECRSEVAQAARLVDSIANAGVARRQSRHGLWAVALAAAALVLAIALPTMRGPGRDVSPVQRGTDADRPALVVVSPGSVDIAREALTFIWRSASDATYRVLVTGADGAEIWSATTRDTTISVPPSVPLDQGESYLWSVDALRADGSSLTSGPIRFGIRHR